MGMGIDWGRGVGWGVGDVDGFVGRGGVRGQGGGQGVGEGESIGIQHCWVQSLTYIIITNHLPIFIYIVMQDFPRITTLYTIYNNLFKLIKHRCRYCYNIIQYNTIQIYTLGTC